MIKKQKNQQTRVKRELPQPDNGHLLKPTAKSCYDTCYDVNTLVMILTSNSLVCERLNIFLLNSGVRQGCTASPTL